MTLFTDGKQGSPPGAFVLGKIVLPQVSSLALTKCLVPEGTNLSRLTQTTTLGSCTVTGTADGAATTLAQGDPGRKGADSKPFLAYQLLERRDISWCHGTFVPQ